MGLELKQSAKLLQQLVMTPQLQQAIKLLQLSRLELVETVNQELLENPMLEQVDEDNPEPEPDAARTELEANEVEAPAPTETAEQAEQEKVEDDFDWESFISEYSSNSMADERSIFEDREAPSYENMMTQAPSLEEHLMWQLKMGEADEHQMRIGACIIGNIDGDGYLKASLEDVALMARESGETAEATPVSEAELADVGRVLEIVHHLDPLGVAARDLRECLIVQATVLYPGYDLVHDILENHLQDLEKRKYQNITRKLGVTMDEVAEALEVIKSLDPKPGRTISPEEPRYITPDIYIDKIDGEWVITLNEEGMPRLKVNNFYRQAIADSRESEAKEYVKNKLRSAMWLIKAIHQRQRTLYKVAESILKFQMSFFERGIAHLRPLVLREVAEDVGMHESTISRVTTNKYMHTPRGVFELKFFFNSGIKRVTGGAVASEAVKERIKKLISEEPPHKPLSDQAIADILKRENLDIARRTVAKYREMMNILPSSRRKQPLKARKKGG